MQLVQVIHSHVEQPLSRHVVVKEEVGVGVDHVVEAPQPVSDLLRLPLQHVDIGHHWG